MTRIPLILATFFGCGYFPWGPGTIGSLAGVLIAALLYFQFHLGRVTLLVLTLLLLWPAIWSATQTERIVGKEDPGLVVIDEVLGQWVTLLGSAVSGWKTFVAAFVLFRLFDIWKPWPVRELEKLAAGSGIVADDLGAGIYGALILYLGGVLKLF